MAFAICEKLLSARGQGGGEEGTKFSAIVKYIHI